MSATAVTVAMIHSALAKDLPQPLVSMLSSMRKEVRLNKFKISINKTHQSIIMYLLAVRNYFSSISM